MRRRMFLCGLLAMLRAAPLASSATLQPEAPPAGALAIIGGALREDNAVVWRRIVAEAGGQGARIAVIPAAAAHPERSGARTADILRRYGAEPFVVPLSARLSGTDYRHIAEDASWTGKVQNADGVFFVGGDQRLITQALVRSDGQPSAMLQAIWGSYRRGGLIAGTSAGAAIMSATMFSDARPTLQLLQNGIEEGRDVAPGLGFIGPGVFIDQHFLVRGRLARMLSAMAAQGYPLGIGVDENTAIIVSAGKEAEVVGYKGVLVADLTRAQRKPGPFNLHNARLSYLDAGDKLDLRTRQFLPGPDKVSNPVDRARPSFRGPVFSNDILGNNAVVDVMEKLIDGEAQDGVGIAAGDPRARCPMPRFEFRFYKTTDSVGYRSETSDAYSIFAVALDVTPKPTATAGTGSRTCRPGRPPLLRAANHRR